MPDADSIDLAQLRAQVEADFHLTPAAALALIQRVERAEAVAAVVSEYWHDLVAWLAQTGYAAEHATDVPVPAHAREALAAAHWLAANASPDELEDYRRQCAEKGGWTHLPPEVAQAWHPARLAQGRPTLVALPDPA